MEEKLWDTFLPALFQGDTSQISGREITNLPVKQAGIALPKTIHTAGEKLTASCVITGHLAAVPHSTAEFRSVDHNLLMGEVREEILRQHAEAAETALG